MEREGLGGSWETGGENERERERVCVCVVGKGSCVLRLFRAFIKGERYDDLKRMKAMPI